MGVGELVALVIISLYNHWWHDDVILLLNPGFLPLIQLLLSYYHQRLEPTLFIRLPQHSTLQQNVPLPVLLKLVNSVLRLLSKSPAKCSSTWHYPSSLLPNTPSTAPDVSILHAIQSEPKRFPPQLDPPGGIGSLYVSIGSMYTVYYIT